ncbi:hypothetical protein AAFF_G00033620 [Aldrovandia affinis]|uniref:Uncharacterized protein n=1 Tax=Aldrovandia affinis TaxID=143900 RepID=A0AAD7S409_9TELE|nr:hypothetical protein AAFF_G00033620 [Aldrovandia affinis]
MPPVIHMVERYKKMEDRLQLRIQCLWLNTALNKLEGSGAAEAAVISTRDSSHTVSAALAEQSRADGPRRRCCRSLQLQTNRAPPSTLQSDCEISLDILAKRLGAS